MRGYFISLTPFTGNGKQTAFLYELEYSIHEVRNTSGLWSQTKLETQDDFLILKPSPGHYLRIRKLPNGYFDRFCQNTECSCDGWMEGKSYSPYKVTIFSKHDRMFLLLAMDLETDPVDVRETTLNKILGEYRIVRK